LTDKQAETGKTEISISHASLPNSKQTKQLIVHNTTSHHKLAGVYDHHTTMIVMLVVSGLQTDSSELKTLCSAGEQVRETLRISINGCTGCFIQAPIRTASYVFSLSLYSKRLNSCLLLCLHLPFVEKLIHVRKRFSITLYFGW